MCEMYKRPENVINLFISGVFDGMLEFHLYLKCLNLSTSLSFSHFSPNIFHLSVESQIYRAIKWNSTKNRRHDTLWRSNQIECYERAFKWTSYVSCCQFLDLLIFPRIFSTCSFCRLNNLLHILIRTPFQINWNFHSNFRSFMMFELLNTLAYFLFFSSLQ